MDIQGGGLSASYRYNGASSIKISGIDISPKEILRDCHVLGLGKTWDLDEIRGKNLPSGSTLTVGCTRTPENQSTSNGQKHYPGGILTVATESEGPRLPLIAYSVPAVPEPAVDALNKRLDEVNNRVTAVDEKLSKLASGIPVPDFGDSEIGELICSLVPQMTPPLAGSPHGNPTAIIPGGMPWLCRGLAEAATQAAAAGPYKIHWDFKVGCHDGSNSTQFTPAINDAGSHTSSYGL
jgi:hypothetical protein